MSNHTERREGQFRGRSNARFSRGQGRQRQDGRGHPNINRRPWNNTRQVIQPFARARQDIHQADLGSLRELLNKEPEEIIMKLASPQFKFLEVIQQNDDEQTEVLLLLVSKACNTVGNTGSVNHLLQTVNTSSFLIGTVVQYITGCRMKAASAVNIQVLQAICSVLKASLDHIPAASSSNITAVLAQLQRLQPTLPTEDETDALKAVIQEVEEKQTTVLKQIQGGILSRNWRDDFNDERTQEPPNDFRQIPVGPAKEDLHYQFEPFLRKNKTTGSYRDVEQYLDIQFRLLREDYMFPLRQGIRELRRAGKDHLDERYIQDVNIYNEVHHLGTWYNEKGTVFRFQFNVSRFRHVRWEYSKRLMYGSLVCLSANEFTTFFIGTVTQRESKLLEQGQIDILIDDIESVDFTPATTYKMVECSAYFEAYKHNLESLQELDESKLPFCDYLLNKRLEPPSPPRYLQANNAMYDFGPLLKGHVRSTKWTVVDKDKWMQASDFGLDQAQFNALQMALTHEFALIQGPPGTGKTYIALKIVELLLHNFNVWGRRFRRGEPLRAANCPILLVCYTNHALDQFLEGILECTRFRPGSVVRVGGRCKSDSEKLTKCQLSQLRHNKALRRTVPRDILETKSAIFEQMKDCEGHLSGIGKQQTESYTKITAEHLLLPMMSKCHKEYFEVLMKNKNDPVIREWLFGNISDGSETPKEDDNDVEQWDNGVSVSGCDNISMNTGADEKLVEKIVEEEIREIENERQIDGENYNEGHLGELSKHVLNQALNDSDIEEKHIHHENEQSEKWQKVGSRKALKKTIRNELKKKEFMSEAEESTITDLSQLPVKKRWSLYRLWRNYLQQDLSLKLYPTMRQYNALARRLEEVRNEQDYHLMRNAKVIAMTTTGAAKNRHILQRIQPVIVIVEEAAEVLEAHIISSLSRSCEHLILIGDHQQLRPKPTVYKLAKQYNLDVSLFERMLNNDMPYQYLETQHRMRPEIAELIVPHIYTHLFNHASVEEYDDVRGINGNVFFVHHKHAEMQTVDSKSRKNIHEAEYLSALCRYLIQQGYAQNELTILTTYTGQMFEIKKIVRRDHLISDVRVTPVDNFQGEENDIILLSLVRSNEEGKAGFLKISNRICVALSRAKKGLYVIGNMELMEESSPIWKNICHKLSKQNKIVDGLPLFCQNHPQTGIHAVSVQDFSKAPDGGCTRRCEYRLKCGHGCQLSCHPTDPEHKEYKCQKRCEKRVCLLGHQCQKKCFEECGPCNVMIKKTIPTCLHEVEVPCHTDPAEYKCKLPCKKVLSCGHLCSNICGVPCHSSSECVVIVPGRKWPCGHILDVECFKNQDNFPCNVLVKKIIPTCLHEMEIPCHIDPAKYKCTLPCKKVLSCGHLCSNLCGDPCHSSSQCKVIVPGRKWPCGHYLDVECSKNKDNYPCRTEVERLLKCGHSKIVKCSEDISKAQCMELVEIVFCERRCRNVVTCCMKKKTVEMGCQVMLEKVCVKNVEHKYMAKCCEYDTSVCNLPCGTKMPCGHVCQGLCGTCFKTGQHKPCLARCGRKLPCQHHCMGVCGEPCGPCQAPCKRCCPHGMCKKRCWEPCRCEEKCIRRCQHSQCSNSCWEECSELCDLPCPLLLHCGHRCPCYCGEPCAKICPVCHTSYYERIHKSLDVPRKRNDKYVTLLPCNHVIPSEYMDKIANEYEGHIQKEPREFKLFQCPRCIELITWCPRYQRVILGCQEDLIKIKEAVKNSSRVWEILSTSDLGHRLLEEIRHSSRDGFSRVDQTLKDSIGCVSLLNEVENYVKRIKNGRQKVPDEFINSLERDLQEDTAELEEIVNNYSLKQNRTDMLSLKVQLLHMNGILVNMLTYIKNTHKQSVIRNLLSVIKQADFRNKSSVNIAMKDVNLTLCEIIPLGLRNGIDDYQKEAKKHFKTYTDMLLERKWILCKNGHAFSIRPTAAESAFACPVCLDNMDSVFDVLSDDDDDDYGW